MSPGGGGGWRGAPRLLFLAGILAGPGDAGAVPPLVIGDVPTADPGEVELYVGTRYEKDETAGWEAPFTEIVVGVSSWQELTLEMPYLFQGGRQGVGDLVPGTKLLLLRETVDRPGVAASVEWKLANGSQSQGLGTGAMELGLLLRSQKTWGAWTTLANLGYTFVGEPQQDGVTLPRRNVGFAGLGEDLEIDAGLHLLAEVYWRSADVPGDPARLGADVGVKGALARHLWAHVAAGTSLRRDGLGGPRLRLYGGVKWEFAAF